MITLPGRAYIAIPAELRRRRGLQPGDPGAAGRSPGSLPRTARSGHRHQPTPVQQTGDRAHFPFPADEARQHHREAMHATPGTSRPGPLHARNITTGCPRRTGRRPPGRSAAIPAMTPIMAMPPCVTPSSVRGQPPANDCCATRFPPCVSATVARNSRSRCARVTSRPAGTRPHRSAATLVRPIGHTSAAMMCNDVIRSDFAGR